MITYFYLNKEDKTKLNKMAQKKQLSLSTTANIIYKHYYWVILPEDHYFHKDATKTCIKIKNENKNPVNTMFITNALYAYLHNDVVKTHSKEHLQKINSKIQSEMDTTFDPNFNKNLVIREMYKAKSQLGINKQC